MDDTNQNNHQGSQPHNNYSLNLNSGGCDVPLILDVPLIATSTQFSELTEIAYQPHLYNSCFVPVDDVRPHHQKAWNPGYLQSLELQPPSYEEAVSYIFIDIFMKIMELFSFFPFYARTGARTHVHAHEHAHEDTPAYMLACVRACVCAIINNIFFFHFR